MSIEHTAKLSSSEIAMVWGGYIENTMSKCVLSYFLSKVEDPDIRTVLEYASDLAKKNIKQLKEVLDVEKIPVPHGFTDSDVNLEAPTLFADNFFIRYLLFMGRGGEATYSLAHGTSGRKDIRELFKSYLTESATLYDKAADVMLKKGIFVRSPYISYPTHNENVQKENFLSGFIGEKRPLTALELSHVATNVESNAVGTTLLMGFSQGAQTKEVKKYMARGFEIGKKHIEILDQVLKNDNLPSPLTWDGTVREFSIPPFTDKLMMQHILTMNSMSLGNYGTALGGSPRRDIGSHYLRFIGEIGNYSNDGAEIMITNGWVEKPPTSVDRQKTMKPN